MLANVVSSHTNIPCVL